MENIPIIRSHGAGVGCCSLAFGSLCGYLCAVILSIRAINLPNFSEHLISEQNRVAGAQKRCFSQ
jgi:hypothetical protein